MPENEQPESTEVSTDTQPTQSPNGAALAINESALPARSLAAEKVTDVLPPAAYERIGQFVLSTEAEGVLNEPLPDDEVDIRPDDGMIYASHEYYRRQLNRAFGRMGWTLVPGSPLTQRPGTNEWYQRWVLFVNGVYAAEAFESYDYQPNNARMDLSDVAEAIKSGALKRCCKDLGLATECWNKRFQQRWRNEHAIQVVAKVFRRGQEMNAKVWRRKDSDPLPGEIINAGGKGGSTTSAGSTGSQQTGHASNVEAGSGSKSTTSTQSQSPSQSQPSGNNRSSSSTPNSPNAKSSAKTATSQRPSGNALPNSGTAPDQRTNITAAGAPNAGQPTQPVSPGAGSGRGSEASPPASTAPRPANTPRLLDSQVRLLFARGRNAGLIVGEDATPMLEYLGEFGISVVISDGKTSTENCNASMKNVPPNQFTALVKKLDELAKAAKPDGGGDAEKI